MGTVFKGEGRARRLRRPFPSVAEDTSFKGARGVIITGPAALTVAHEVTRPPRSQERRMTEATLLGSVVDRKCKAVQIR